MAQNGDQFQITKKLLGHNVKLVPDTRFIFHRCLELTDKNKVMIYEGDIIEAPDKGTWLVIYAVEKAAYLLLGFSDNIYYPVNRKVCETGQVIGNIFENRDLLPEGNEMA